jgi:hypothetical protein
VRAFHFFRRQPQPIQAASSGGCGFIPKPVLPSEITLLALAYIFRPRLERRSGKSGEDANPPQHRERLFADKDQVCESSASLTD